VASAVNYNRELVRLAAATVTAILVWFGTGLQPLWPLLWFAPLPILWVAMNSSAARAGLLAGCAWLLGSLNMWHYFHGVLHVPYAVLAGIFIGSSLVFTAAVLLFRALAQRGHYWFALVSFPAMWVAFEYALNISSPHGTALSLSYSQLKFLPVLQLASITGPWGISYVLFLFSASIVIGVFLWPKDRALARRILGAGLGAIVLVLAFGTVRLLLPSKGTQVRVGLIASDEPNNVVVADDGAPTIRLLRDYAAHIERLAARGAKVVVLPEKLGVLVGPEAGDTDNLLQSLADKYDLSIIVGLIEVSPPLKFNQARIYSPGTPVSTYDKHHLLPPFESNLKAGTTLTFLPSQSATWGIAICKDMDFTPLSREYGAARIGLMLVPAWDFNLDRTWHGHIALMRGVESGFSIARAAKQGYLTVSDNRGRVIAESRSDSGPYVTLLVDVPEVHVGTFYILAGDWFAWAALAVLAVALIQSWRTGKRRHLAPRKVVPQMGPELDLD
jgi:apolipoprotein N-acyltransferase